MSGLKLPTYHRTARLRSSKLAFGSLTILLVLASILTILPAKAFPVPVPTYYLSRQVSLTGEYLSPTPPGSQTETVQQIPKGGTGYFYSQPQAEGMLAASQWIVTFYAQADPGQGNTGSMTVQLCLYSMDGTTLDGVIGTSNGNVVPTTVGKVSVTISGTNLFVANGDRLALQVTAETGAQNAASITLYYDGQGVEPLGDSSRIATSAILEVSWRQDFEVNPFAPSSVNKYWQASSSGVTQDSTQYYTGSHSMHVSDTSSTGTYARYDFNSLNNPSYSGLPRGTTLSFYWLSTANAKGTGILSDHILILDQNRTYEFYWYWSSASTSKPPALYPGTTQAGGTYMGTITLGTWTKNEIYDWQKHAEVGMGVSFQNPTITSISLQSVGANAKPTDVYWDNLFASSYTASSQPTIVEEGQTTTISLQVTGAVPSTTYQFQFTVTDPSGAQVATSVSYTTGIAETSFTVSKHYPVDFQSGGALVGSYNVSIQQVSPVYLLQEGSSFVPDYITAYTNFTILLTNKASSQRTEPIRIQATGYNTLEKANITITGPGTMYVLPVQADSTGLIVTTWQSPRDAPTGTYTITVQGSTTVKAIPDRGTFQLTPAILQLTQFSLDRTTYQRTQNVTVDASLAYPDQSLLQDGSISFQVRRPDGLVMIQFTMTTQTSGLFTGSFKIPTDAPTGAWEIVMSAWGSGDPYGNIGPAVDAAVQFTVDPAVLQVQSRVSINSTATGRTLIIQASITYPDGTSATMGQASAELEYNGMNLGNVQLLFDRATSAWVGYYEIKDSDPEGLWLIVISAQDLAGPVSNSIENVVHNVLIDAPAPSWDFGATLVAAVLVSAGGVAAFVLWHFPRQKVLSVELETDKVMQTVNRVQSTDFFRSIRDQLRTASAKSAG